MSRMKHLTSLLIAFVISMPFISAHAEEAPASVKALVPQLEAWSTNGTLVEAVKAQNAQGLSLEAIKSRDTEWRAVSGLDDFMQSLLNNAAAQELKSLESTKPFYVEMFLMDNQGANVAMTNKTSDYWQGDEAKFTESFASGNGAVHLGEVEFDESAQAYLVQISIPIMDGGQAIGALTIGVNLDELEANGG